MNRLKVALNGGAGVAVWVFVSAGLTALITWALQKPEYIQYYGVLNIVLYFLYELKKKE
jgi:hypothetical protein